MSELELASAEDCRLLYDLTARIKELAPWEFMDEADLFGVIDPDTGEPNFVSVMGAAGEHYAVALYKGVIGLYSFLFVQNLGPEVGAEAILDMPQIQASFENREMVEKRDREHMKALGLKFRGRHAWPIFRSYRAGYAPWFIDKAEARTLTYALEQLIDVVLRLVDGDDDLLWPDEDEKRLVRVPERTADGLVWRDETMAFDRPAPRDMMIRVEAEAMDKVSQLPSRPGVVEIDCFRLFSIIAPPGERPFFPYALLLVDGKTGEPLGIDMLTPNPTPDDMWGDVAAVVLRLLEAGGYRPREFRVRNHLLFGILSMISGPTKIKVKQVHMLDKLDRVAGGLTAFLDQGGLF